MRNDEANENLNEGWTLLLSQARIIAMLPIEEWLQSFENAETVAPILDPTLYRDYLYSRKGELLKSIFVPALALKRAVLAAQEHPAMKRDREARCGGKGLDLGSLNEPEPLRESTDPPPTSAALDTERAEQSSTVQTKKEKA